MTNKEKLTEVFGEFMQNLNNMEDLERWLASEYSHHEMTFIGDKATKKEFETLMYYPNKEYDPRIIDRFLDSQHRRQNPRATKSATSYTEQKDGQMTFLKDNDDKGKDKDLYHFEGWASWHDDHGYPHAGEFDMHTYAKSGLQALNNIKARIKKQNGWPMDKRVDIYLNDGVSSLTKVFLPISEYRVSYPDDNDITIVVKARNIKEVYEKLQAHNISFDDCDTNISLGEICKN